MHRDSGQKKRVALVIGAGSVKCAAASGIHRIANARMTRALRAVSSEKGRDPRDYTLIAFGGNGPIFAAGMAQALGMTRVIVPPCAGGKALNFLINE